MRNDEFNKIEITNEKQTIGFEFGKTQKLEATFQKDNKLPEGELNEKYIGKTIRKKTEVNVQYENKAVAPVHGSTTVTSATTASNVAATTATVVTAASVVAVTAVAVGTGISIVLHSYDYQFNSFEIGLDYLVCDLLIMDNNRPDGEPYERYFYKEEKEQQPEAPVETPKVEEDKASEKEEEKPFVLRVYNDTYECKFDAKLGVCEWYFEDLKPDQKYHISLSEKRFGGETIFDKQFTTLKEETRVSEFRGISWDKTCNFLTMMMNVRLDYQDDYDRFSDFKFNLKSEAVTADVVNEISYDLVKTTEEQQIQLNNNQFFNLVETYEYTFTYMDEGVEVTAEKGTVHFEDNSGAKSEWNKFIFDKTANFINRIFEVQLDFVDDFNVFDNFVLSMFRTYEQEGATIIDDMSIDIPLQKTAEVQIVDLDGYEVMLSDSYHYKLTCNYYDELKVLDEGDVTFTDTSGAVTEFRELIFDKKANFDTRTFEVQLDYTNDLGYLYGFQFTLTDLETSNERTYYLQETTDVQTITVDEIEQGTEDNPVYLIDVVEHRMSYSFKYMNQDMEYVVVEGEEFKFENSLVSTFQDVESPYDFGHDEYDDDYLLPIKLIYDDAAHVYSVFEIKLLKNNELYGRLMMEGERGFDKWQYATFTGMEGHQIEDIIGSNITMSVVAMLKDGTEEEAYSKEVTFTLEETKELYDLNFDDGTEPGSIVYGNYQIGFTPIYSGKRYLFHCTLNVECQSGRVYEIPFDFDEMNQITYAYLGTCDNFSEDNFEEDFNSPVKLSITYFTYHYEMVDLGNGSGPMEERVSDNNEKTVVIHESYQFTLQA